MKRKTNLFYAKKDTETTTYNFGEFISFSNYGEGLTQAFAATNKKLFPSMFLCFDYTISNKTTFMKKLVTDYENRLAVIRDSSENENICPLGYLLEVMIGAGATLKYIGEVTEEDYNGTYTDIICNINNNCKQTITPNIPGGDTEISCENTLHGWDTESIPEPYNTGCTTPTKVKVISEYESISWVNTPENTSNGQSLTFNIVVPLFNIVDINTTSVKTEIENKISTRKKSEWVPLGMWICPDSGGVTLKYSNGFGASWSLSLGMQFKPFPYSNDYNIGEVSNKEDNKQSFATFAEVLYKQNEVLNKFKEIDISSLKNKVDALGNLKIFNGTADTAYEVAELISMIKTLPSDIGTKLTTIQQSISQLENNVNSINSSITTINTTVNGHSTSISTINTQISSIQSQLSSIMIDVNAALLEIRNSLTEIRGIETRINAKMTEIDEIKHKIDDLEDEVDTKIATAIAPLNTSINSLNTLTTQQQTAITTLQTKVTQNETNITNLNTLTEQQQTAITTLQTKVTQNETNITNLTTKTNSLESTLNILSPMVTANTNHLSTLDLSVKELLDRINDLDNRVKALEEKE